MDAAVADEPDIAPTLKPDSGESSFVGLTSSAKAPETTVVAPRQPPEAAEQREPAPVRRQDSTLHLIALFAYLGYVSVPHLGEYLVVITSSGAKFLATVLLLTSGVLAILGGFTARIEPVKAFTGGMLGLGFLLTATYSAPIVGQYLRLKPSDDLAAWIWILSLSLFCASWFVTRPIAREGYIALPIGIVALISGLMLLDLTPARSLIADLLDAVLLVIVMIGTVILALTIDKATKRKTSAPA